MAGKSSVQDSFIEAGGELHWRLTLSNRRIDATGMNARICGRARQRFLFLPRNHSRIGGRIPARANLIFIARIHQRPEHTVKLARRFHGPIATTVGNQLHGRSWSQSSRQRIVVGVAHRENIPNPFPFLSAPHTPRRWYSGLNGRQGVTKSSRRIDGIFPLICLSGSIPP